MKGGSVEKIQKKRQRRILREQDEKEKRFQVHSQPLPLLYTSLFPLQREMLPSHCCLRYSSSTATTLSYGKRQMISRRKRMADDEVKEDNKGRRKM